MPLIPGSRIGPYEVLAPLGAGGMGEVYRARDTKLNRDVALKVLSDRVTHDPSVVARFRREAQVLAALNHPNIGGIYGLEDSGGVIALVLELVDGPTLADRIAQGPIPLDEVLRIATQMAVALEAAHDHGIVHRDLKPANIKLRPDGTVKVLDFGLAKATEPQSSGADVMTSPTLTSPVHMTGVGVILGTAAYMSPEQAAGRSVDRRSDIWSFGVVLLEMLTGRRVFAGETIAHVMAAVLREDPDLAAVPESTPEPVRRLLRRCLEKDPKRRLDSATTARLELTDALLPATDRQPAAPTGKRPARAAGLALVAVVAGVIAALVTWALGRPVSAPSASIARFTIVPPADLPLRLSIQSAARDFAVAPDGSFLVYRAGDRGQLAIRRFDRIDAVALDGVVRAAMPFISPDSRWVGFVQDDLTLRKVAVSGGAPVTLAQLPVWPRGASWVDDATIIVGTNSPATGLLRVPAGGGEPTVLTKPDRANGEEGHVLPSALPGGDAVLFTIGAADPEKSRVAVLDLRTGAYTTLLTGARDPQYVSSGHIIYLSGLSMSAVRFDPKQRGLTGEPVRVVDNVATAPTGALNVSVTSAGTMVLVPGSPLPPAVRSLVWLDREGHDTPIAAPPRAYESARISPDGSQIALGIRDQQNDVWTWNIARQTLTRLTFNPDIDLDPVWTPDGSRVVFASARTGAYNLYAREVSGGESDVRLTSSPNTQLVDSLSPDGRAIVAREVRPGTRADLVRFALTPTAGATVTPSEDLVQTPFDEWNGEVSPNGRFLAYQSGESGRGEVYVRPYPQVGTARWQASAAGGLEPMWSRDGRELLYLDPTRHLVSVPVEPSAEGFHAGPPTTLNAKAYEAPGPWRSYDVSRDGQRVLVIRQAGGAQAAVEPAFVVVQNWFGELARLAPSR